MKYKIFKAVSFVLFCTFLVSCGSSTRQPWRMKRFNRGQSGEGRYWYSRGW